MEVLFIISVTGFLDFIYCLISLKEHNIPDKIQKSSNTNCNMPFSEPLELSTVMSEAHI
jgi:hypothetical protein